MLLTLFGVFNVGSEFGITFEGGVVVIVVILFPLPECFVSVNTNVKMSRSSKFFKIHKIIYSVALNAKVLTARYMDRVVNMPSPSRVFPFIAAYAWTLIDTCWVIHFG